MIYAAIVIGCVLLVAAVLGIPWLLDRHHQRRAEADLFGATQAASWQKAPPAPTLHHDWLASSVPLDVQLMGHRFDEWPEDTLAPALQDATPEGGPSAGARAPEPPAGDEAPGPDGAPEGDGQAARPPQGTTGPGDLLAKASAAVAALPVDKYLDEAGRTTAYADDRPWNPLSAETIARGMPAIKEEVAP